MKKILIILSILPSFLHAQFEGKIVYQQSYESSNPQLPAEALAQFMGSTHEYYVSENRYASITNGIAATKMVYYSSENKLITYFPNGDSLTVVDATIADTEIEEATKTDGKEKILSWECKSLVIKTNSSRQTYFYAEDLKIKSRLFRDHKYGNWDTYTKMAGAFPLKYVMEFPQFTVTSTAVSVEEMELPDSFFDEIIPEEKLGK